MMSRRRWILTALAIAGISVVLFVLLGMVYCLAVPQAWQAETDKIPSEWQEAYMPLHENIAPYLHIVSPYSKSKKTVTHFVVLHGSSWPLEYCYDEYKQISDSLGVDIVSLEYPGFGKRKGIRTTEQTMLVDYPQEVMYLVEAHLGLSWNNVVIVAQCFGVVVGLRIASHSRVQNQLHSLVLTKPFTSWHNVMSHSKWLRHFVPVCANVFNCFKQPPEVLLGILCSVYCVHGVLDNLCAENKARDLLLSMTKSRSCTFLSVSEVGHELPICDAITLLQQNSPGWLIEC
jgi:hypothetical protein